MLVQQVGGDDVHPVEQVADALVGVVRRATHDSDDLVTLGEQQFGEIRAVLAGDAGDQRRSAGLPGRAGRSSFGCPGLTGGATMFGAHLFRETGPWREDRKSTRLNSSHSQISYAVFCLKKKKK